MKETNKKDKPDIKNKYYELGWFSTKIKEVKINSLEDICNWIDAMCELADKGSQRQIWGAKKKNDRGMLGILTVCQKNNEFKKVKDLPNGIFDCVNLKNLLDKINECVTKTNRGRTKKPGFSNTLDNCNKYLNNLITNIRKASNELQASNSHTGFDENCTLSDLGHIIYIDENSPLKEIDCIKYQKAITKVQAYFENIEKNKLMKLIKYYTQKETASNSIISYLGEINKYSHCWINEKIVDSSKALKIKSNIKKILEYLKKGEITFTEKDKKEWKSKESKY